MFKLSNGETYSRLEIYCFDDLLGYITKTSQGYRFTLVKFENLHHKFTLLTLNENLHHKFTLLNLSENSTSEEIRKWMKEHLTITDSRANRSECYLSWCKTMEDEISVYSYFLDCSMRRWVYV